MFRTNGSAASPLARAETREENRVDTVDSDAEEDDHADDSSSRSGSGSASSGNSTSRSSTSGGTSDSSGVSGFFSGRNRAEPFNVGRKESQYVSCLKLIVIAVIVVSGVFMVRATFQFMQEDDERDFEDEVRAPEGSFVSKSTRGIVRCFLCDTGVCVRRKNRSRRILFSVCH